MELIDERIKGEFLDHVEGLLDNCGHKFKLSIFGLGVGFCSAYSPVHEQIGSKWKTGVLPSECDGETISDNKYLRLVLWAIQFLSQLLSLPLWNKNSHKWYVN